MQWPPTPGPGRERHEPERLGRRGVDDLPDVEAHPLAQQRELVDEGDVDVAEDVLEQLGQLGGVRRGDLDDLLLMFRSRAAARAVRLGGRAADEARHALAGAGRIARVDPLGREGEVEVAAGDEPGLLERLAERTGRRARERRRLEDRPAGPRAGRRGSSSAAEITGPRSGSLVDVIGVGTQTKIASASGSWRVRRRDDSAGRTPRPRPGGRSDVVDRRRAGVQLGDRGRVGVDALDREPGLDEGDGQRQADVAEADDRDTRSWLMGPPGPGTGAWGGLRVSNP